MKSLFKFFQRSIVEFDARQFFDGLKFRHAYKIRRVNHPPYMQSRWYISC